MERLWQTAKLTEIPESGAIPVPGLDLTTEQELEALSRRDPAAWARWEAYFERWPEAKRTTHAVRRYFGIGGFGCNAYSAAAGNPLIVPHSEEAYGQEELYLVVEGRAVHLRRRRGRARAGRGARRAAGGAPRGLCAREPDAALPRRGRARQGVRAAGLVARRASYRRLTIVTACGVSPTASKPKRS